MCCCYYCFCLFELFRFIWTENNHSITLKCCHGCSFQSQRITCHQCRDKAFLSVRWVLQNWHHSKVSFGDFVLWVSVYILCVLHLRLSKVQDCMDLLLDSVIWICINTKLGIVCMCHYLFIEAYIGTLHVNTNACKAQLTILLPQNTLAIPVPHKLPTCPRL